MRILIVDDNIDDVHTLAYLLKEDGYSVELAVNGADALELASRFEPQVVLVDIRLPDTSGLKLAQELRCIPSLEHAYLIAITGQDVSEPEAKAARFDRVLRKPIELSALESLLK